MSETIRSYQAALDFISLHPNKILVATNDGGLREKSIADSLRSIGSFLVGRYSKKLDERNAAVAARLISLFAASDINASNPRFIAVFNRYFQAQVSLNERQPTAKQKSVSKVSKGAINSLAGAKKVSPKTLGRHIFDSKPQKYQLEFSKAKTQELLNSLEHLASEDDVVGQEIDHQSGLAQQYIADVERQENFFTHDNGVTTAPISAEGSIATLKRLAVSPQAARALSCIANQASILTLLTDTAKNLVPGQIITPAIFNDKSSQEHHLTRLENGNIQYQFQFYAPINGISSDHGDFLETKHWSKPQKANASEYDLHLSATVELDATALNEGRLQIVKHHPFTFHINIKLEA